MYNPEDLVYPAPLSPHLAAKQVGETIQLDKIQLSSHHQLIIEGAGGVHVPINKDALMIDLIQHLTVPVIIVVCTSLGTINHTLLTIEVLRNKNIPILGIVGNGMPNVDNMESIAQYGKVHVGY